MINKLCIIIFVLLATTASAQTTKDRPIYLGAAYLYGNAQGKFKANDYDNGTLNTLQLREDDDEANFYYGNAQEANGFKVFALFPLNSRLYIGGEFSFMDYSISDSITRTQAYNMYDTDEFFTHAYPEHNRGLHVYKLGTAISYRFDIKVMELQPALVIGVMGLSVPNKMMTLARKKQYSNYHDAVYIKTDKDLYLGAYGSLSMRFTRRLSRSFNATMAITHDLGFANVGYQAYTSSFTGNGQESSSISYTQNVQSIHFDIGFSFCVGGGKGNNRASAKTGEN